MPWHMQRVCAENKMYADKHFRNCISSSPKCTIAVHVLVYVFAPLLSFVAGLGVKSIVTTGRRQNYKNTCMCYDAYVNP